MRISAIVAFACAIYIVSAASIYSPEESEVVREKRSPIVAATALGLGGASLVGASALGAGVLGAGLLGAGALGAGALGVGVAKGAIIGGAIGRSYGGGYGHYGYGPSVRVVHHYNHGYDDGYGYSGGYGYAGGYGYGGYYDY
ncbi:prisilkin-39-like [Euwallacea similis]|uniref:prisilkin-39-like n=1 Tax=Euwallacea similis TaxID=1736056 RepID=UPI00344C21A9